MTFANSLEPAAIVIFGASGDLTKRKLLPALYRMVKDGSLPEKFTVIGVARTPSTKAQYQVLTRVALEASSEVGEIDEAVWARFSSALDYQTIEYDSKEHFLCCVKNSRLPVFIIGCFTALSRQACSRASLSS